MSARLSISYRRSRKAEVIAAKAILEAAGVNMWLDLEGTDGSHAMRVWWSADYADSDICLQKPRIAWQHARRRSSDVARRVWILNPEARGDHVRAGELNVRKPLGLDPDTPPTA